jgi:hypothetical protein
VRQEGELKYMVAFYDPQVCAFGYRHCIAMYVAFGHMHAATG